MTDMIITNYPQRIGAETLIPGDRLDIEGATASGFLNETVVEQFKRAQYIAPATPESFRNAVARRPAGAPWPPFGFTQAYLEEKGLVSEGFAPEGQEPGRSSTRITRIELTDEKIAVGPYFLQPKKNGRFTLYEAADADGFLLRAKPFRKQGDGEAFLVQLEQADTPDETDPPESSDGGDLQPELGDAEGSDPPEDR